MKQRLRWMRHYSRDLSCNGRSKTAVVGLTLGLLLTTNAQANWLRLANSSQSVAITFINTPTLTANSGGTILDKPLTIEASVMFTDVYNTPGGVYREYTPYDGGQTPTYEDKALYTGTGSVSGQAGGDVVDHTLTGTASLTVNQWHHIVYEFRYEPEFSVVCAEIFVDGNRLNVAGHGNSLVYNSTLGLPYLGASPSRVGMVGYVNWFRISNSARYTGTTYTVPTNKPTVDANTVMLFTFDEDVGSTTTVDKSSNGFTVQFGHINGGSFVAGGDSPQIAGPPSPSKGTMVLLH